MFKDTYASGIAPIAKLSPDVVNRIAAGEVAQRPSAVLKELLENALDAGSTSIQVSVQEGGLEVLQVSDDGCGVRYDDLPLLCERFATSKLRSFDDLQHISSFGFRGEALASISYVARVTVTTMCRDADGGGQLAGGVGSYMDGRERLSSVAWRCRYMDGRLVGEPVACAGNPGTTIRVEKMFYNSAVRRRALSRPSEEYSRIVDVVSRYALAFAHVGFSCHRDGSTTGNSGASVTFPKLSSMLSNIRLSYGSSVASHLRFIYYFNSDGEDNMALPSGGEGTSGASREEQQRRLMARAHVAARRVQLLQGADGEGQHTIVGYTSDSTLQNRKPYLCLFVNHRLVESGPVRKAIEAVYSPALTGGHRPFTVLAVSVPADRVDVNVHPTKSEVCLLDEEIILARIAELTRAALLEAATERQLDVLEMGTTASVALRALAPQETRSTEGEAGKTSTSQLSSHGPTSSSTTVFNALQKNGLPVRRSGGTPFVAASGTSGGVVDPSTIVRVEQQKGALDRWLHDKATISTAHPSPSPLTSTSHHALQVNGNGDDGRTEELMPLHSGHSHRIASTQPVAVTSSLTLLTVPHGDVLAPAKETVELVGEPSPLPSGEVASSLWKVVPTSLVDDDADEPCDVMHEFKRYRQEVMEARVEAAAVMEHPADERDDIQCFSLVADKLAEHHSEVVKAFFDESATEHLQDANGNETPEHNGAMLAVPELDNQLLTSVGAIVAHIRSASSLTAQAFVEGLVYVGVVDEHCFLAQSGTTLFLLDTLRLVREVVYQRIFHRWASPGMPRAASMVLVEPVRLEEMLYFALQHDAVGMCSPSRELTTLLHQSKGCSDEGPEVESATSLQMLLKDTATLLFTSVPSDSQPSWSPTTGTRKYVRQLVRRLHQWRSMLAEYFGICISPEGVLVALPYGLNTSWPPVLRAAPLLMWFLADAVPYVTTELWVGTDRAHGAEAAPSATCLPEAVRVAEGAEDEAACFHSIAQHVANILYGLRPPSSWSSSDPSASAPRTEPNSNTVSSSLPVPSLEDAIRFGLLPCMKNKQLFSPPASMLVDGGVQSVVSVETLYKVFERC